MFAILVIGFPLLLWTVKSFENANKYSDAFIPTGLVIKSLALTAANVLLIALPTTVRAQYLIQEGNQPAWVMAVYAIYYLSTLVQIGAATRLAIKLQRQHKRGLSNGVNNAMRYAPWANDSLRLKNAIMSGEVVDDRITVMNRLRSQLVSITTDFDKVNADSTGEYAPRLTQPHDPAVMVFHDCINDTSNHLDIAEKALPGPTRDNLLELTSETLNVADTLLHAFCSEGTGELIIRRDVVPSMTINELMQTSNEIN